MNSSSKAEDLTTNLQAAALWATQWDIEFNWAKCKILHFGRGHAPDLVVEDELDRHVLEQVDSFRDLGVLHSLDVKHHQKVAAAVVNARSAAFLIRRVFTYPTPEVFLKANTALVRTVVRPGPRLRLGKCPRHGHHAGCIA